MLLRKFGHQAILHDKEGAGNGAGDDTTTTQSSDTDTTQSQGDGDGDGGDPPKTYTQAELDQKLKGQGSALKSYEAKIAKFEADKAKRDKADDDRKTAELSDLEKAQKAATDAIAAQTAAETARDEAITAGRQDKATAEARSIVATHGPVTDSVLTLIPTEAQACDDNGALTAEAKTALEKWIKDNTGTLLKGTGGGTGPAASGPAGRHAPERKDSFGQNLIDLRNKQGQRS